MLSGRRGGVLHGAGSAARALLAAAALGLPGDVRAAPVLSLDAPPADARTLLILGIFFGFVAFAVVAALLFLRAARRARRAEAKACASAGEYSRKKDFLKAVLAAEPQFLVHWNEAGEPAVVADTLGRDLGIPRDLPRLLRFASWLERESALEIDSRVAGLLAEGEGFNLMLKSAAGAHLEADGRAAGGGSVLKLRDLAGRRAELAGVAEQHERLDGEIRTMRALLDSLAMPVWLRGPGGGLEWVNRAYARAVDAAGPDQVYEEQIELLPSRQREAAERRLTKGDAYRGAVETAAGGENRRYETTILPVGRNRAGIAMDEGRSGQAGTRGGTPFERLEILDRIATAITVYSAEQRLVYCNEAFVTLWGLDRDWLASAPREGEILDKLREDGNLPEQADYRAWRQARLDIYHDGKPREDWWHLPDGRTIHVVAERGGDGGATCLYEDMSETLALKSRYNALMHVQKETLDHLGEGVAVFGSDGRLKLFNPAFAAIWNLEAETLEAEPHIDRVIAACRALLDDEAAWSEVKAAVTSIDDEREPIEGQLERPDGVFLAYAGLPLPDGGTLLTYVDISDSKRMQNALIERNEALLAADRLKSAFISHVSYELRTPLTNIIGFSEFLQNPAIGSLNEKQREYLGDIRSSSDTLLAIIDDILDMATIDAGNLELRIAPASAREIVDAAILGVRERLNRSNIGLDIRIHPEARTFMADARRMTQVLYNLLSNAVGFSEPDSTVRLACRRDGAAIAISVEDQGCGIPEDYQQSAFDRFESRPQGSHHRGAGLGLSIVKSLVELHGGGVELDSMPGEGTRVTVRFPAEGASSQREADSGDARERPPSAAE